MTGQLSRPRNLVNEPWYGKAWGWLKRFPNILAEGSKNPPTVSGVSAAALLSAAIGCFTMMVSHHLGDTSKATNEWLWNLGSWIPGSKSNDEMWGNIGSYTGKQTMLLIGWLVSWAILHFLWRNRNVKSNTVLFWLFAFIIAATVMSWHPLFPYMPLI